ncbi:hypothetical protein Y032_0718g1799 [Ancylostoma ceylanicum]|uniref:Uncharacterized protein n=1 Tax=Ancylostoma ceylanicum TaxID=53326 RepID=A0A016WF02_9BILA|nr:hypothetical protein Y032_0718g1799 [Ancylostoma ceylanicum]
MSSPLSWDSDTRNVLYIHAPLWHVLLGGHPWLQFVSSHENAGINLSMEKQRCVSRRAFENLPQETRRRRSSNTLMTGTGEGMKRGCLALEFVELYAAGKSYIFTL